MEDKLKYGYDFNAEKMSFEDFAYKWLESVKDNIAYGTYAGYKQALESRIIPYFKGYKVAHIKTPHIEAFYRTLVDDYATGTIKRFANVLNLIFKTAKRYSMIENNPCQDAQKPKRKDEDEGLKFFTPKQALMFMKSLDMSYEVTYKMCIRDRLRLQQVGIAVHFHAQLFQQGVVQNKAAAAGQAVSYTHLDVYKRQAEGLRPFAY